MRVLRDFKCANGHVTERFIDSEVTCVECPNCEENALRQLGYGTIILDGTNPDFPGAYNKWATVREQRHKLVAKKNS